MTQNIQSPLEILQKYFGHSQLRSGQQEIIGAIIAKNDCLAILPTGGGKSVCFQVPGLIFPGITIVVSPLISLMKDQVDTLNSKKISACYISSLLSKDQLNATYELIQLNKYKFIYIAPERLESNRFQKIIAKLNISLLVIDEAHCISSWGDSFRPSYQKIIHHTKTFIKNCPIVAFTATANKRVQAEICRALKLNNPYIYYKSFARTNLYIEVIHTYNQTIKNLVLLRLLKKHKNQAGIIYCSTRNSTEQLAEYLNRFGVPAIFYHGGLTNIEKQNAQVSFCNGHKKIIVATNAFGMGIDVENIRFVIHYQIPGSIENYYQEIGRAGRDQNDSFCYLFFCKSDTTIQYKLLKNFPKKIAEFEKMKKLIQQKKCRSKNILEYFGENILNCNNCDVCRKIIYKSQLTIYVSKSEIFSIRNILQMREKNTNINKQFPITDTLIAYLALIRPKDKSEYLAIPGIGIGFITTWFAKIKQSESSR